MLALHKPEQTYQYLVSYLPQENDIDKYPLFLRNLMCTGQYVQGQEL